MDISLSEYSQRHGLSKTTAWRNVKAGKVPGAKMENGEWRIASPEPVQIVSQTNTFDREMRQSNAEAVVKQADFYKNQSYASTNTRGSNRAANSIDPERFCNFDSMYSPILRDSTKLGSSNGSCVSIKDVIRYTRLAYYNISDVRLSVDTLVDFSSSKIYLTGGNKKSRDFYEAWFKVIGLFDFTKEWFLEGYRSGNVFVYPLKGKVNKDYIVRIQEAVGEKTSRASKLDLPLKYFLLNPSNVIYSESSFAAFGKYYQELGVDEVKKLKTRETEEEKQIFNSLPKIVRDTIDTTPAPTRVTIPLDANNVIFCFFNKLSYEPFSISMIWPVLDALNRRIELNKMDSAVSKSAQQILLHVKLGYENRAGDYIWSAPSAAAIQEILTNESVFKVIITDFTGEMEFKIPQIAELLDPKKYEIVNQEISSGLQSLMFGGASDKFANLSIKTKVFVEKLKNARELFLNKFLIPEMEKIAEQVGFRNIPTPKFEDISLEDPVAYQRLITRLAEIGLLTPAEVFTALETNRLPTEDESREAQTKYKEDRTNELYLPLIGGATQKEETADGSGSTNPKNGRPIGTTGIPKSTNKISPIGTKKASFDTENYELSKILEISKAEFDLKVSLADECKKFYKLDKLSTEQQNLVSDLSEQIMASSDIKEWKNNLTKYIKGNYQENKTIKEEINKLARDKNTTYDAAKLLYFSQKI